MFLGSALPEWDAEMPTRPGLSPEIGLRAAGTTGVPPDPSTETRPKGKGFQDCQGGPLTGFFLPVPQLFFFFLGTHFLSLGHAELSKVLGGILLHTPLPWTAEVKCDH